MCIFRQQKPVKVGRCHSCALCEVKRWNFVWFPFEEYCPFIVCCLIRLSCRVECVHGIYFTRNFSVTAANQKYNKALRITQHCVYLLHFTRFSTSLLSTEYANEMALTTKTDTTSAIEFGICFSCVFTAFFSCFFYRSWAVACVTCHFSEIPLEAIAFLKSQDSDIRVGYWKKRYKPTVYWMEFFVRLGIFHFFCQWTWSFHIYFRCLTLRHVNEKKPWQTGPVWLSYKWQVE